MSMAIELEGGEWEYATYMIFITPFIYVRNDSLTRPVTRITTLVDICSIYTNDGSTHKVWLTSSIIGQNSDLVISFESVFKIFETTNL